MSAGSQVVTIRLSDGTLAQMRHCIEHRNEVSGNSPWDFSAFIRKAIYEKLDHMERARAPRKRKVRRAKVVPTDNGDPKDGSGGASGTVPSGQEVQNLLHGSEGGTLSPTRQDSRSEAPV
jgi:hypothetical protein